MYMYFVLTVCVLHTRDAHCHLSSVMYIIFLYIIHLNKI